jgi:transcriptional regulator with XRE-family HTH domain
MTRRESDYGPLLSWHESRRVAGRALSLRVAAGREQKDVADAAGLSHSSMSGLERACIRWRERDAEKVARVLGTDLAGLLGEGER